MTEIPEFIPLNLDELPEDYDAAVEKSQPPKVPPGKYDFELLRIEFHEAQTGRTGLRFTQAIISSGIEWNGRELRYDGWWNTGFLTNALLAYAGPERWPAVRAELACAGGLTRIRDGTSKPLNALIGSVAVGVVEREKGQDGELWPRLRRFVVVKKTTV